jgi:hypothetical protein
VLDAQPHRRVHVEIGDAFRRNPRDFLALAARAQLAADQPCCEADRELLPDLTIVGGHDVIRVGVRANNVRHVDVVAGFLIDVADDGVANRFSDVVPSAGQGPEIVVCLVDARRSRPPSSSMAAVTEGTTLFARGASGSST